MNIVQFMLIASSPVIVFLLWAVPHAMMVKREKRMMANATVEPGPHIPYGETSTVQIKGISILAKKIVKLTGEIERDLHHPAE